MKKNSLKIAACLGLAQFALSTGAVAQQEAAKDLNEVVVTATRSPKKISEIGKVVRIIDREQLDKSQGRTLPEVLNNVAGLTIGGNATSPGELKSVYLRGASAGNTLILIDGIPVNDASGITGEYDISAIAIDQIERVEILKGGNSTLYGSDAVAGVINIITKKGVGPLSTSVLATGGSFDTYKVGLGLSGNVQRTRIGFNFSNLDSKGFSTATPRNGATGFDKDGFHQRSASINLGQRLTDRLEAMANFQINNNEAGLDGGAFTDTKNYNYNKTAFLGGLGAKLLLKNNGFLTVNASRNIVENRFASTSLTKNVGRITNLDAVVNTKLVYFLDLTAGANYKFSQTEQYSPFGSPLFADNNIKSLFGSLFFSDVSGFHFELGGRYNNHSQYGDNLTYTINPSYLFAEKYKIFANISSAYKVPSLYQLFSQYGNLALKPERSKTYEAGFDLNLIQNKLNVNLSYFRREIKDVIDFGATGYINQNLQEDKGYELETIIKPLKAVTLSAFFAHVDGTQTTPFATVTGLSRRPKNSVGGNLGWNLNRQLSANLIYKWNDSRFDRYYDTSIPPFGAVVRQDLEAFNTLDLYLQYQPFKVFTLFADVKNVFDESYIDFVGYTTKGRNFNVGLRWEIR